MKRTYESWNLAKWPSPPFKGKRGRYRGEKSSPGLPLNSPLAGEGKRAKERAPAQVGRAGGQGRGGHMIGTHSVEHNAKKSVHPLDEATEYLV